MLSAIGKKIFGSRNERELKRVSAIVHQVNELEKSIMALDDEELRSKTGQFKERIAGGESMDDLLPEAFAVVRETARRMLNMRHFDVQIIGGVFLHEGTITEMKTGEGKTLVATLSVYLNSLTGHGVHVVTVNDYLATRDSEWMGKIYRFLGLDVGIIRHDMGDAERKAAYAADVTYGTNNEFGFDYLRDNMKFSLEDYVQGELNFAIVDEVDSILIDEARTPLIISGPAEESTDKYYTVNKIIPRLKPEVHYTTDEKARSVMLTEDGVAATEKLMGVENLYEPVNIEVNHHVQQALKAHVLFKKDVDYVVKNGQVIIVDEFTGRLMEGRRYSDGLHQALEAKEGVKIESENQTLASITFQNYFRMYNKLSGMTGTADTEAAEFKKIYDLDVVVMPTNLPMIRQDNPDVIYRTRQELNNAVVEEITDLHRRGQPVLVGTASIENSEVLSGKLKRVGVPHHVLNAKHHEREAEIIAQAGRLGAVTIATNMAGRGTDIVLGGNPESLARNKTGGTVEGEEYQQLLDEFNSTCMDEREGVLEAGGLHILGTERHESRRIDNQLRGRSGRQGDPGSSRFYISLEDDLMRIFGSERISGLMERLGMTDGQPIENSMVTKAIENAQKKVEGHNFDIRKHLLDYDDVMNQQREVVYGQRRNILGSEDLSGWVMDMGDEIIEDAVDLYVDPKAHFEDWELEGLGDHIFSIFGFHPDLEEVKGERNDLLEPIVDIAHARYKERESEFGSELMRRLEKIFLLQVLDAQWKDHLYNMDQLREGIGLRGYGQRDPLSEYKIEGYEMFEAMMIRARDETVKTLYMIQVTSEEDDLPQRKKQRIQLGRGESGGERAKPATVRRTEAKIGRNAPCPCGSGKKYKKCCGSAI
ncbi:MAG TPA: preprotein translocase subunit SecA [Proteobacteria bacterium]|nr:preprotein translocase subunit SecA [bacterium BMS3Abin14]HDL53650.1 preprotein translocase subunit SecA [Pseudomonadota bacterium]